MTRFIQDSANAWYDQQRASGRTDAELTAYLQQFDQWDRDDDSKNGNVNEPDGSIDHLQAVHAGEGEKAGAPEWAIWSHRWSVGQRSQAGPAWNKAGGVKIGNLDLFSRDYTHGARERSASVSSRTRLPTTWACPTSMTPVVGRTALASGH
jgi:M6 family metalloprotease-like protein